MAQVIRASSPKLNTDVFYNSYKTHLNNPSSTFDGHFILQHKLQILPKIAAIFSKKWHDR